MYQLCFLVLTKEVFMKKVVFTTIIAILLVSCSAPIIRSGKADIEIALGGVIPQISQDDRAFVSGTKAITPNTLTIRATITGEQYSKTIKVPVLTSTTLLTGLPAYEPLTITLEALDYEETPITSWTSTVTLNPGRNSIRAIMKPVDPVVNYPVGVGGVNIPFGKARFYRYYHDNFNMIWLTQMLKAETYGRGSIWMGVYNENWEPLETIITESKADGWAVFDFTGSETIVYIALAYIRSDGYPPNPSGMQVDLTIKDAYFVNPQAATNGSGTSNNPFNLSGFSANINDRPNAAFFLGQGTYSAININGEQWLLGGFDSSNWKKRTPRTSVFTTQTNVPAITLNSSVATNVLDGLTVRTDYPNELATAIVYNGMGSLSILNCEIVGVTSQTVTSNLECIALNASLSSNGTIFIYNSTVSGGTVTSLGNNNITLSAIKIQSPVVLTVLRSTVDGGTIRSLQASSINLSLQTSAIDINVGNDSYTDAIIASSFIWGGVINSNLISPRTQACIFGDYSNVYITSSILSAGYISYTGTSGSVWMTALGNYSYGAASLILAGSIIDAGYFETASSSAVAAAYEQQSTISATIASSVFITNNSSYNEIIPTPLYRMTDVLPPNLLDCAFIGPVQDAYDVASLSYKPLSGTALVPLSYDISSLFVTYTHPTSFAQFFANNWKPAGALRGLKTTTLPASWGLNSTLLSPYPYLIIDLENNVRPADAPWALGPYQN